MNMIKFAALISYLTRECNYEFETAQVMDINDKVLSIVDEAKESIKTGLVHHGVIDELLKAMKEGKKIDAIRAYRALTGQGLKESKDAVEANWVYRSEANNVA